jgi:hypothetical protein
MQPPPKAHPFDSIINLEDNDQRNPYDHLVDVNDDNLHDHAEVDFDDQHQAVGSEDNPGPTIHDMRPVQEWQVQHSTEYLDELIRLEGCGDSSDLSCAHCNTATAGNYRCIDCCSSLLFCLKCCVELHRFNPLHRIKVAKATSQ